MSFDKRPNYVCNERWINNNHIFRKNTIRTKVHVSLSPEIWKFRVQVEIHFCTLSAVWTATEWIQSELRANKYGNVFFVHFMIIVLVAHIAYNIYACSTGMFFSYKYASFIHVCVLKKNAGQQLLPLQVNIPKYKHN